MAKKVPTGTAVAYLGSEHPGTGELDGPGFYEIKNDDHGEPEFGKRVEWVKNSPEKEGEAPDQENNEGHWVYAEAGGE